MESQTLETRLGPVAWQSSGHGPTLVFFAGALANHDLWRDVVAALEDHYRCITIDLPLGAHPWPLSPGADRSATSLARLLLDCLELLDVEDATVVANDTAGGLLLLSLDTDHPALGRIGRLVLTNCDNYDQFPPDALKKAAAVVSPASPTRPGTDAVAGALVVPAGAEASPTVTATRTGPRARAVVHGADATRSTGGRRPRRGHRPVSARKLLVDAAGAIPRFDRPVLLIWGDACDFFPMAHAQRLASDFPDATLVAGSGSQGVGPDRQSGGGDRGHRRVRAGAGALIAGAGHGARERRAGG